MKDLVEYIAKALVEDKEAVVVKENIRDKNTLLELSVAPAIWARSSASRGASPDPSARC